MAIVVACSVVSDALRRELSQPTRINAKTTTSDVFIKCASSSLTSRHAVPTPLPSGAGARAAHAARVTAQRNTAALVGVACTVLKLSKALVGFVIILGDERGVFKHPPLH
jgi:hypothetical protein